MENQLKWMSIPHPRCYGCFVIHSASRARDLTATLSARIAWPQPEKCKRNSRPRERTENGTEEQSRCSNLFTTMELGKLPKGVLRKRTKRGLALGNEV